MIQILPEFPDTVLAISATGLVTDADYKTVLIPAAEDRLLRHDRLRVLYHLGPRFERFEAAAMFDDAAFGLRHLRRFERIAVVTDLSWCRNSVRMLGFMMPCPVRVFADADLAKARDWILEPSPTPA
ncbi:MAG TPA: STAS/SEC14 domain-containing protein [Phycisphaerales bacterium]|nr:STAS/SEC14 domain-containing protein [Phycisphaerales bacterium]